MKMHFLSLSLLLLESPRLILVTRRKILNYYYVPQHKAPALQWDINLLVRRLVIYLCRLVWFRMHPFMPKNRLSYLLSDSWLAHSCMQLISQTS